MPFDLGACVVDVATVHEAKALRDLPAERGKPPPVTTQLARVDKATAAATAAKLVAALPKAWAPKIELDVAGMAKLVEMHVPGEHTTIDLAPAVLAFVRAHPCLFGVVDPKALDVHVIGDHHQGTWVLFDVKPRSVGVIQADVERENGTTRVSIEGHLWPIADVKPNLDLNKMLARYLGLQVTIETGSAYMVDPVTHEHTGCVPLYSDKVTEVSTFRVKPGPILACHGNVLDVVAGAYVWHDELKPGHDAVLDELPASLDPDGNRIGPSLAVVLRTPDQDDLFWGATFCTP